MQFNRNIQYAITRVAKRVNFPIPGMLGDHVRVDSGDKRHYLFLEWKDERLLAVGWYIPGEHDDTCLFEAAFEVIPLYRTVGSQLQLRESVWVLSEYTDFESGHHYTADEPAPAWLDQFARDVQSLSLATA